MDEERSAQRAISEESAAPRSTKVRRSVPKSRSSNNNAKPHTSKTKDLGTQSSLPLAEQTVPYEVLSSPRVFFMPVDEVRAQMFLSHGLIFPAAYDTVSSSVGFNDLQDRFPTELILFEAPHRVERGQLLLRVLVHQEEAAHNRLVSGVLRLPVPLPISRLVGIEVPSDAANLETYVHGWVKPDVPVPPRQVFRANEAGSPPQLGDCLAAELRQNASEQQAMMESVRAFDRYMGLMAFVRNADRYFSCTTGQYADYPKAFFSLCAALLPLPGFPQAQGSDVPRVLLALLDLETELTPSAKAILAVLRAPDAHFDKDRARSVAAEIEAQESKSVDLARAFRTLFDGDYRTAVKVLRHSNCGVEAQLLAALFKYSLRASYDYRSVKQRLHEDWANGDQAAPILAALGAYFGYTALDAKEYRLYCVHPLLRNYVEDRPDIKFHLRTALEREAVEAMYHWAFFRQLPGQVLVDLQPFFLDASFPLSSGRPPEVLVRHSSYQLKDLENRSLAVTRLGAVVHRIAERKEDFVDERSETGRVLMPFCFLAAEEFEFSRKGGKSSLAYRISKTRLLELLTNERIRPNLRVLDAALEEDDRQIRR